MDNPQEVKKAILAALAEKGDYKTLLEHIGDEPDLKQGVLAVLAEKRDYGTILKALNDDDKKKQTEEAFSKIAPLFQFSEMITKDAKGSFMSDLKADLDEKTKAGLAELAEEIEDLKEDLREITATLLDTTKSALVQEHLGRYSEAEKTLGDKMLALTVQVAAEKAQEMFGNLAQEAKLTEDEIEDIIEMSALSVESQIAGIIGEYISETKITPDQIVGFAEAVKKLLPAERQVSWGDIVNKPDISQGGTSAILVKRMIDEALADFSAGSGIQSIVAGTGISVDNTDPANPIVSATGTGTGDMEKAVYDTNDNGIVDSAEKELVSFINKTGATLTEGTIVYLKTSSASGTHPEALKANASTETTSSKTIGAVYEDVANDAVGYIVTSGEVHNLDTSAYSIGDRLWLATTDGLVTTTPPSAPNHKVFIGTVTRAQNSNGRILYAIQNGYEVDELHDVSFTSLANDDFFQRKGGLWVNRTPAQVKTDLSLATVATSGDYNDLSNRPDLSVFDEVEQHANLAAFPATGNVNKFYLAQDTGIMYRWTGSGYDVISASLALGETSSTAYRGDRGEIAYDHSQIVSGNPHGTLAGDISDFVEAAQDAVGSIITGGGTLNVIYDDGAPNISLDVADNSISAQKMSSSNGASFFGKSAIGAGQGEEIDVPVSSVVGRGPTGNLTALLAGAGIVITDTEIQATGGGGITEAQARAIARRYALALG